MSYDLYILIWIPGYLHWHTFCKYVIVAPNENIKVANRQSTISHNYVNRENYCKSLLVFTAATSRAPRVFRIQYSVWLHINVLESNEIKIHFIPRFCQYCPGVCRLHCLWGCRVLRGFWGQVKWIKTYSDLADWMLELWIICVSVACSY